MVMTLLDATIRAMAPARAMGAPEVLRGVNGGAGHRALDGNLGQRAAQRAARAKGPTASHCAVVRR